MALTTESRQHMEQVAGEALTQLDSIATAAKRNLHDGRTLGSDALASVNTMTYSSAIQNLDQISQANRESYQVLAAEPAIVRVVVVDEEGEERTYYICRTTPVSGFQNVSDQPSTRFSASRRQNRCPLDSGGHLFWRSGGKTVDVRSAATCQGWALLRPAHPAAPVVPTGGAAAPRSDSWAASAVASARRSGMPTGHAR